ncbi:hypothetical protein FSARC_4457 [Fusarium sarcochroum]|uniref:Uncharacterized protein n=1 Tax=Fusarium sarcochroum TaxID=1208366 RepID=A0A8H4U1M2_9HYPO|nr:hypothetical protein FSARC_4457 [Fusarium sarcochroum]
MSLPVDATTITGGCSCGAIRYRIAIPMLEDRPYHPMSPPNVASRLPDTITCQCNDCPIPRETQSTIVSGRILDVLDRDYDAAKADSERPPFKPATEVFRATEESKFWLRFFHTTNADESWSRSFCGRSGSHVCFHFKLIREYCHNGKLSNGWQDAFHLYLGGIDREFLEKDWFTPSTEVMFQNGTPFSQCVSATAKGLKYVSKVQEFDREVTEKELAKLRA